MKVVHLINFCGGFLWTANGPKEIVELWQRFMGENILEKIPNKVDGTVYLTGKSFGGGTYIKTSAKGDFMEGLIVNHWSKVWEIDLDRAYTADFEAFGEKAQNPLDAEVDFYVAIKE